MGNQEDDVMNVVGDIWYRYNDITYAPSVNEWGDSEGHGDTKVEESTYKVEKVTPKGVWIRQWWGVNSFSGSDKRFVLTDARKRYACPTKEDAMVSFLARKNRQLGILKAQTRRVEIAINIAEGKQTWWFGSDKK